MAQGALVFDRALLARRRARWAGAASDRDFLLRQVGEDLALRIAMIRREFPLAVNLGAYTGILSRILRGCGQFGTIVDAELCPDMLGKCDGPRVCANEELLPFRDASLDAVVSALSLQSVNDLPGTLLQIRRALKPDGLLLAAMLGGETLRELREAFLIAEAESTSGASPRVAPFADVRTLGALLQRARFALPVADSDTLTVTYESPLALMAELRAMGCANVLIERSRQPLTRSLLIRACEVYRERHSIAGGRIKATFEIITLTAWAPDESQPKPLRPGSAKSRLADALGVSEHRAVDPSGTPDNNGE